MSERRRGGWLWPVGLFLIVIGSVWTAQGLGWLEGSPMTGETVWAVVGPIVVALGVVLAGIGLRK